MRASLAMAAYKIRMRFGTAMQESEAITLPDPAQTEPKYIVCPTFLLAGESDDITTKEQVLSAEKHIGTPKDKIASLIAPGGHIGLFMGSKTLKETWPQIARWISAQS
jgi:poly(3-hydroxyalkanoate) synthetase